MGPDASRPRLRARAFAEEHVPRLTERFYRVDVEVEAPDTDHRGTGLGLAIVKHILARHRATMSVASQVRAPAPRFTVTFPKA